MLMKMVGSFHEQVSRAPYTKISALLITHTHSIIQLWLIHSPCFQTCIVTIKLQSTSMWVFFGLSGVEPGAEIVI